MSTTLAEPAAPMVDQQNQTPVVPYVMLIITTHFDLASHVLQRLQSQVPTIEPALSDLTRKKADGCLIVDVPLPDLPQVERLLDTMPKEEVYDYIPVQFE
jgi:hypothetical protein